MQVMPQHTHTRTHTQRERERERERRTHAHTEREREQRERETHTRTHTHTQRERERDAHTHTRTHAQRERERERERRTHARTHTHARARAHTHTHTHTPIFRALCITVADVSDGLLDRSISVSVVQEMVHAVPLTTTLYLWRVAHAGLALHQRVVEASQSQIINQNGATSGFEMCFAPSTLGAGSKRSNGPNQNTSRSRFCTKNLLNLTHIVCTVGFSQGTRYPGLPRWRAHCQDVASALCYMLDLEPRFPLHHPVWQWSDSYIGPVTLVIQSHIMQAARPLR